jgi:hypothetical protein
MTGVLFEQLSHVQDFTIRGVQLLVVARQAQVHRLHKKKVLDVGSVYLVAIRTRFALRQGVVLYRGILHQLLDGVVALDAKPRRYSRQHHVVSRSVRIVTRGAILLDRRMSVRLLAHPRLHGGVTFHAHVGSGGKEQGRVVRGMWAVADSAGPYGRRTMQKSKAFGGVVVAVRADRRQGVRLEESLCLACVGVVTGGALSICGWRMFDLSFVLVVAVKAEVGALSGEGEAVPSFVRELVTSVAGVFRNRVVYDRAFAELVMTPRV